MAYDFDFLKRIDGKMYQWACDAEMYLVRDPQTSVSKLNLINERIAREVLSRHGYNDNDVMLFEEGMRKSQYCRIEFLRKKNLIPQTVVDYLHTARMIRNEYGTSHDGKEDVHMTKQMFELTYRIAVWYYSSLVQQIVNRTAAQPVKPVASAAVSAQPAGTDIQTKQPELAAKEPPAPVSRPNRERKTKGYLLPLLLAAAYGIAALVLLIQNHSEVLKFVSDTFPIPAKGGFLLNSVLPAVILCFAWSISCNIVRLLSKVILNHKPVWITLLVAGMIAGGLYGYDQLNPGLIDSAVSQVKQFVYVISWSEAAETEQAAEAMEAVPAAEPANPAAYGMDQLLLP